MLKLFQFNVNLHDGFFWPTTYCIIDSDHKVLRHCIAELLCYMYDLHSEHLKLNNLFPCAKLHHLILPLDVRLYLIHPLFLESVYLLFCQYLCHWIGLVYLIPFLDSLLATHFPNFFRLAPLLLLVLFDKSFIN